MREHQRANLSRQNVAIPELKSLALPLNLAAAVDQKAGRDVLDAELPGEQTVRVEDDAKARDVVLKEPLGVGMHVIHVDRDDDKTVRTKRRQGALQDAQKSTYTTWPLNAAMSSSSSAPAALAAGDANTGSRTTTRPSAARHRISMRIAIRIEGHA